uniref:S-adenosyl-l-methionine hydroxide adenosyltransferase N-terminal domain-containing protein n=1 Tax=Mesoaciditoga lauensis TaxID=1495039 RepID=A0A7V3RDL9_9BACT
MIAIITDHGSDELFMGVLKGSFAELAPDQEIIEVTHPINIGDVYSASCITERLACHLPKSTIFLTIVDGQNESARRPIVLKTKDDRFFIGFDNGAFTMPIERFGLRQIREINIPKVKFSLSFTRSVLDILIPVAIQMANGKAYEEIGNIYMTFYYLKHKKSSFEDKKIEGEIVFVNDLGDLSTNIPFEYLTKIGLHNEDKLKINGKNASIMLDRRAVRKTELTVCEGLGGYLEITANYAHASKILNLSSKSEIVLEG